MKLTWNLRRLRGTRLHRIVYGILRYRDGAEAFANFDQHFISDRQMVEVMRRVLRPDSNCIDIGSHRGDIVQYMVTLAPNGTHYAFEALPHFVRALRARFPQVTVHQAAATDVDGQADFHFVQNDPGYSGLRRRIYDRPNPRIEIIPVTTVTVDAVIPSDQRIAFMKIDIEGGEYDALKGAINTIRRGRPVILFEAGRKSSGEYGVMPGDIYTLVTRTLGYDVATIDGWLAGAPTLNLSQFTSQWDRGIVYNFLASPA